MSNANIPQSFVDTVNERKFVVLDTETTGLHNAEIVSIAIVSADGDVLLNTLVHPTIKIPADATRIHGITDEMVKDAPTWREVWGDVFKAIAGHDAMIYNVAFDVARLNDTHEAHFGACVWWSNAARYTCVMHLMTPIAGHWSDWHQNYKWPTLQDSLNHYGLTAQKNDHTALSDALATLAVINAMAQDAQS